MRLSELLSSLSRLAKENQLSEPYIVGGIPRDKAFGEPSTIKDIDITTGDDGALSLALVASREWPEAHLQVYDDGHASLQFENIQVDFSNNYNLPDVEKAVGKKGLSDIEKEVYSRDFTINTLLQPADLNKPPKDLTGKALNDIYNRVLRTPVDPNLTIGHDPRRILRAIKLAMKYDLKVDPALKDAIIKYRGGLKEVPMNQIKKQVNQMLEMNPKKAIEMLSEYKLLPILPLSKLMMREMAKNRMIQYLLEE